MKVLFRLWITVGFIGGMIFCGRGQLPAQASINQDSLKIWTLIDEFNKNESEKPEKALEFGKEALRLAKQKGDTLAILNMYNNLGIFYVMRGDYTQSLSNFESILPYLKGERDRKRRANTLNNIGGVYYEKGDLSIAHTRFKESLALFVQLKDTNGAMISMNNLGSIDRDRGNFSEALETYMKVLGFQEQQGDTTHLGLALYNVGNLYLLQGDPTEATDFFERSLKLFTSSNQKFRMVMSMNGLSKAFLQAEKYEQAYPLLRKSLSLARKIDDLTGLAEVELGIAEEFLYLQDYDSALVYGQMSLESNRELGRTQEEAQALLYLGQASLKKGMISESIYYLQSSLSLSAQNNYQDISRDGYMNLSEAYSKLGNYKAALDNFNRFFDLHDSIFSKESKEKLTEMKVRYETEKKNKTIDELKLKNSQDEIAILQSNRRVIVLIASVLVLLLLALSLFLRFRSKKRLSELAQQQKEESETQRSKVEEQNRQIQEINANLEKMVEKRTRAVLHARQELDTFLYQSAHALRRPLTSVQGLVSFIKPKLEEPEDSMLVEKLEDTVAGMDTLLKKLVAVNEIQTRVPELQPFSFSELIDETVTQLEFGDVRLDRDFTDTSVLVSDPEFVKWLLTDLLENSIHFCREETQSWVKVSLQEIDEKYVLTVSDNGKGIPDGQVEKVLAMFHRADVSQSGSGLGLYLVGRIVERLFGKIYIESKQGEGTQVRVELPLHRM